MVGEHPECETGFWPGTVEAEGPFEEVAARERYVYCIALIGVAWEDYQGELELQATELVKGLVRNLCELCQMKSDGLSSWHFESCLAASFSNQPANLLCFFLSTLDKLQSVNDARSFYRKRSLDGQPPLH